MVLNMIAIFAISLLQATSSGAAHTNDPLATLTACHAITASSERLACYDREVQSLLSRRTSGELVVNDVASVAQTNRAEFGLSATQRTTPDRTLGVTAPDNIKSSLVTTRTSADGKMVFVLEDGSSWVQTDQPALRSRLTPGMEIEVRKALLGGFFLNAGTGREIRVRRLD